MIIQFINLFLFVFLQFKPSNGVVMPTNEDIPRINSTFHSGNEMYVPISNSVSAFEISLNTDVADCGENYGGALKNGVDKKEVLGAIEANETNARVGLNNAAVGQTDCDGNDDLGSASEGEDQSNDYNHLIPLGFFMKNGQPMVCMYGTEYSAGSLDLTYAETLEMQEMNENGPQVQLNIHHSCIKVDNYNVLDIERIRNRDFGFPCVLSKYNLPIWDHMVRIELSMTKPLMAKYEDVIYTVGKQLLNEYRDLTNSSQVPFGVNIFRLYKNRLVIDNENRVIDVSTTNTYTPGQVCFIKGSFKLDRKFLEKCAQRFPQFKRYVIKCSRPYFTLEQVDLRLVYSSKFDDCSEIYAESDSMFMSLSPEESQFLPASKYRASSYSKVGSSSSDRAASWVGNRGANQSLSRPQGCTPSTSGSSEGSRATSPSTSDASEGSRSTSPTTSISTEGSRSASPSTGSGTEIESDTECVFIGSSK